MRVPRFKAACPVGARNVSAGLLKCLASPPHLLMVAGHGLDQLLIVDGGLCLTVTSFDPELMRLAVASCPFMYGGMMLGSLFCFERDGMRAFLVRISLQLGAMVCAMAVAAHLWFGSSTAALLAMMVAMSATGPVGRGIFSTLFRASVDICMHRMENPAKRSVGRLT
ncbi:hypothetical protein KAJ83_08285 [Marivibrio halodurans]|uniref:Uncharacterized protein n=1 Tax=Marivibrio halodurans TaxID=2039722 RepID=A0A8J7SID9_9PROT|nr:hypothetical protein [Marivibrio halodurans]MBP5857003.1 hypothetical protein [Marivibrio halodurans]